MKILRAPLCLLALLFCSVLHAAAQSVTLAGLRSSAGKGSFKAARYAPDGTLILLYDQGDGLRILKTDASATTILAQTQQGSAGDAGVALALDPAGNIYVAGTSTSGTLAGTSGSAFPSPADTTTNSFLARFDPNLNLVFLTFLGAGETVASSLSATADAVFVAGTTYNSAFPATPTAAFSAPASGSTENGFVERLTPDGAAVTYATYLTGASGDTAPAAIVADSADSAFVTGLTSSPGFPTTVSALQPRMVGSTSGFVTRLTSQGDALIFSTFIPGSGLTGLALDSASGSLLLTGNLALGQFPITTVTQPIASLPYQALVRLSTDGQTVLNSALLVPGADSHVTAGPYGTSWVSGSLSTPLLPASTPVGSGLGNGFLLHTADSGVPDVSSRFGGAPFANASFATLTAGAGPPTVSGDGLTAILPATLTATLNPALSAITPFDLPLTAPTAALPGNPGALSSPCSGPAQCTLTAGLLAAATAQTSSSTFLTLSMGDTPNLILRNAGSATVSGLLISASGYTIATNCGTTLVAGAQCALTLSGTGPGTVLVTAANASAQTFALPATTLTPNPLALSAAELDYGIVTSASPVTRTLAVTNLTSTAQSFTSAVDAAPSNPPYSLAETASTCPGSPAAHTVPANSTCGITVALTASDSPANDGPVSADWKIGGRDIVITGVTQAATLSVSAPEIDFGVRYATLTPSLPRFLYLSNSSADPISHSPVTLPASSPFAITDNCPSTLAAGSVCQIQIAYIQTAAPSQDSATLTLDQGLVVQLTATLLPATAAAGTGTNPSLTFAPGAISFSNPVSVTQLSSEVQAITLTNTGDTPIPVSVAVSGDFVLTSQCGASLNPQTSCLLLLHFAPSQPGLRQGLLTLSTGAAFAPAYVPLSATASPLLAANNGSLNLGQTYIGEPSVSWFAIQGSVPSLTASASGAFSVALAPSINGSPAAVSSSAFAPTVTGTCSGCWLAIEFLPEAAGTATSNLTLSTSAGGTPYTVALSGTGIPVQGMVMTPSTQDFGPVTVGSTSAPLTFTLTNLLSPAAPATVQSISASGDFTLVPNTTGGASCTGVLSSTASCFLDLVFAPTATGTRSGTLTVVTSAGLATASLTGTGAPSTGLSISPATLNFVNQPGTGATQATLTLTNTSATPIAIGVPTSSNSSFSLLNQCATLAAGSSCTIGVTFTPGTSTTSGTISIPATPALAQASTVTYSIPAAADYTTQQAGLLLVPTQANFGAQPTDALGQTVQFTLLNTSSESQTISVAAPQNFPLSAPADCPTLAPGASCSFSVSFLPAVGGPLTGSLVVTSTSASGVTSQAISYLLGYSTGSGTLAISSSLPDSSSIDFGEVAPGQSSVQTLTLTNSGSTPLSIRRVTSTPPFLGVTTCLQPLPPAGSCSISVTYAPGATSSSLPRSDTGSLTIDSDATASPNVIELSGVALTASANPSPASSGAPFYGLSQGSLTFADTLPGSIATPQQITLSNLGSASVQIGSILSSPNFQATSTCSDLQPGAACTLAVSFSPVGSANGPIAGWLEIPSNASNSLEFVSLLGLSASAAASVNPASLNFGAVGIGKSAQLPLTLTNSAALPITLAQASTSGDYAVSSGTCPTSGPLPAGQSCTWIVTFSPTASGARTGNLTLFTSASAQPIAIPLTGTGLAPQLQAIPTGLAFDGTTLGSTAVLPLQLSNSGSTALTGISGSITGPDAADFSLASSCSSGSLAPASSCTAQIAFAPTALGTRSATLTLTSSDPFGPLAVPLTGTGTQPKTFNLTVNGSSSATVVIAPGSSATYSLAATPLGGFAGAVVLSCTPVNPGPYASCALASTQITLNGAAQQSTATITTLSGAITSSASTLLLFAPAFALTRRRRRHARRISLLAACALGPLLATMVTGCGGPGSTGQNLTPNGSYQYQVTATSVADPAISSSVMLNLTVE